MGAVVLAAVALVRGQGAATPAPTPTRQPCAGRCRTWSTRSNDADAPAAVAAVERVRLTGNRTNNEKLSARAVALAQVSDDPDRQPAENVNEELVSVADACGDAGRPIRGLRLKSQPASVGDERLAAELLIVRS